ncbi:PPE domain-containing protein [Actinokineospora guangxiensis]|uniref:PPE domain-containing protein n=1 Tax=Actinokineospora guangxiensis TaxID=1490288 RepID=A0ABW0ETB0_9PSEU
MTDTQAPPAQTQPAEDGTRWRGFSHEELYRMLHEGPGATASATPSRRWAELTAALDEVGHQLETSLSAAGTGWVGRAAGAAYQRLIPLSAWAKTTSENAATMRVAVENQGDHIARARADMPAPEGVTPMAPDPTVPPAVQVVGAQTDAEPVEAAKAAGEQRAVEVMTAYENNTKQNLAVLAPFENPAAVVRAGGVQRGGGPGVRFGTGVSGVVGHVGDPHDRADHRPGPREPHHLSGTGASGAQADLVRPQRPLLPAPGMLAGAAPMENFGAGPVALGAPRGGDRVRERRAPGHAMGAGAMGADSAHHGRDPHGSTSGADRGALAPGAPPPHGAAGAPVGGAGAAGAGGGMDKMGPRRFGTEAIGSAQWFADAADGPAPRAVAGRNRDLGDTENVTENVSVDGEDHTLPPSVIGG